MSTLRPQDLIRIKRDGGALSAEQISYVIDGVTDGSLADYQVSALLMAIYFNGMTEDELAAWTGAMVNSGDVMDLSAVHGLKVDKHSTGGVGDKVSLCLAPLVAACGVPVPMVSGRGLGHTGGTLDKLESIPGFQTNLDSARFVNVVREAKLALIGQTERLAPADRRLYALRDVTATVESIPLIASSIMSKKLAEGIDGLVLDVKVGSGAFMKDLGRAKELARTLCGIGRSAGKSVTAFLTDMSQPLGCAVGNANELREAIDVLRGEGPADLVEITVQLGAEMLLLGQAAGDLDKAREMIEQVRQSGDGLQALCRCVELQGGDPRAIEDVQRLPCAAEQKTVVAQDAGVLCEVDAEKVGLAAMVLGAGRRRLEDRVDHGVGLELKVRLGDRVQPGQALAELAYNSGGPVEQAEQMLRDALRWTKDPVTVPPLVYEVLR